MSGSWASWRAVSAATYPISSMSRAMKWAIWVWRSGIGCTVTRLTPARHAAFLS